MPVGQELKQTLEKHLTTPTELARHIGVSPSLLCAIVRGQKRITAKISEKLGLALGQAPDYWVSRQVAEDLRVRRSQIKPLAKGKE